MTPSKVFLGLGSNVEREIHLSLGLKMLEEHLTKIIRSPVFESASIDGVASPFYNLVIAGETYLDLPELIAWIKEIEDLHGRRCTPNQTKISLDIDLLFFNELVGTFGDTQLPRPEILERSYVLYPLYLLSPEKIHPLLGHSMSEIWSRKKVGPTLKMITNALHVRDYQNAAC